MTAALGKFGSALRQSPDLVLAIGVGAIFTAMIIPLPAWMLDLGLVLNLTASVTLLAAALFARDILRVASFPTLLLITTLFRLALNVSSTRLALSEGHAGAVIQAFGELVVRGDFVVGAVIFAILTLVQWLVVAKGAERVAEVSARFSLDAMPGKQMSIDGDLRAGSLDPAEARKRRGELERASQLFGAMDGAMKFVKGDVIAGLLIVFINLIGGTAVGVLRNGMAWGEAASNYALIAMGDGLVSQLPSLLITVAAAMLVTRVAGEDEKSSLAGDIGSQLLGNPLALGVASALSLFLGLVPGMPGWVFLSVGVLTAGGAFWLRRPRSDSEVSVAPGSNTGTDASASPNPSSPWSPLALVLTGEAIGWVKDVRSEFVDKLLNQVREKLHSELGLNVPGFQIQVSANDAKSLGGYVLLLDEIPCCQGAVMANALYVPAPRKQLELLGAVVQTTLPHPVSGKLFAVVADSFAPQLTAGAISFLTAQAWVCEHLEASLRRRAGALLGLQDVQVLLEGLESRAPALVREVAAKIPLTLLTDILRRLLAEQVSIRNLRLILETLVAPNVEGDAAALADLCRAALSRHLSHRFAPSGPLFAYLVDPAVEEVLRAENLGLDPEKVGHILQALENIAATGASAVLLTSPDIRRKLRMLCEPKFPELAVLTYAELSPEVQIRPVGKLLPRQWT
jgi:type III secretion protein V